MSNTFDIHKAGFNIIKQSETDEYYVTWSLSNTQKGKNIHKKVYNGKKIADKDMNFPKAISGYVVVWYYQIGGSWYLDKTSEFTNSATSGRNDRYTPSNKNATSIIAKIKPVSKTYQKNKKGDTDKWFTAGYTYSNASSYNGYPGAPSVSSPLIDGMDLKVKVGFSIADSVDEISIQLLRDESDVTSDTIILNSSDKSLGFVNYSKTLTIGGSYQVRARAWTTAGLRKQSEWSEWSSAAETKPSPPTGLKCEATADDKIKVSWTAVSKIKKYTIEYVADKESYFDLGLISSTSLEDGTTQYLFTGLTAGTTYYFRVRSVNDSDKSDPSEVKSAILAIQPSPPTTWQSVNSAAVTNSLDTTEKQYLYWVHNSKDNSAQRSSELEIEIASKVYYLLIENPNRDSYGELIDKTMRLELWSQMLYTTEGANTTQAGTVFALFVAGGGDTIKWKVRTKGIHASYSDWSVERVMKAYIKPTLKLSITDKDGQALVDNVLTGYPFGISGTTTPAAQKPISFYVAIINSETYEGVDEYGDAKSIVQGAEVFSKYIDSDTLNLSMSPQDVDMSSGIKYTISVIVYMDSGLSATDTYDFTTAWTEYADVPDAEIEYNETYRYTKIRPFCEYYLGNKDIETTPNIFHDNAITGTAETDTIFPDSGIASAAVGDLYFNNSSYSVYICTKAGDASVATWIYKTTFDYDESNTWYFGTLITLDNAGEPVPSSEVDTAVLHDYYLNTETGDIFKCTKAGSRTVAIWEYVWNAFWQVSPNILLNVYRRNSGGTYTAIIEGVDNSIQSSDSALYVKDRHPSFGTSTYRIVAINSENSGVAYNDVYQECTETSLILQWDEKWDDENTNDVTANEYQGSMLELPANIKLSDSSSPDVTLAEYIGRSRPVSYYGTQKGESLKISCEFPMEDTATLETLRRLMIYAGDVYVREPSGIGYWANISVSYDRNYKELTIPVSLDIKPVEGGA